jgi:hypothetical protein
MITRRAAQLSVHPHSPLVNDAQKRGQVMDKRKKVSGQEAEEANLENIEGRA